MKITWNGVYPAITTKFTQDGQLDMQAYAANIQQQIEAGIDGIIVAGSLGETSTLTKEERFLVTEETIRLCKGKIPVLLNIAEQSTREAVAIAQRAEEIGAEGLMLLPPMRYKADDRETVEYFKTIAQASSLPVMIYNNPVDYGIKVTLAMFDELLKLDNVQAVKESTRDITNITRYKNTFGDRMKILCGVDTLALESLAAGADGWVAGLVCAFPRETVAIYRLMKAGRTEEALKIYRWFMPLLELDIHPKLIQYIKLAEAQVGMGTEHVRAPRLPLIGEEKERILKIIQDALAIRPELPTV
ncbi:dihydrodipicolinate synthase family protein [Rapidithrix thailandica]|uniref:Dihydrodipicolinate synthase family protein n=1 Tax=Rapidithrix thailandica TaxID=413964 RepID=A0AAW9SF67_9BACT